jgi:hypothetical protein
MSKNTSKDYEVGYGKPPKDHQYKPGQSGHPGPKKRKEDSTGSAIELFLSLKKALGRKVTVTEKGRPKRITLRQYLVDKYIQSVIKDPKALVNFFKLIERADRADLAGLAGEPVVIQILGGLPDEED